MTDLFHGYLRGLAIGFVKQIIYQEKKGDKIAL